MQNKPVDSKNVVLFRALTSIAEMYFFCKNGSWHCQSQSKSLLHIVKVACVQAPCPNSAEWGFEVDTCCGSLERAHQPYKKHQLLGRAEPSRLGLL